MKKFIQPLVSVAIICICALYSESIFAQKTSPMSCNVCCINAGNDVTIACNGTATLGVHCITCPGSACSTAWSWSPSDYLSCTNCEQPLAIICVPGVYNYTVTGSSGGCPTCQTTTDVVKVTVTGTQSCCNGKASSFEEIENTNINVFPNPSGGTITVQLSDVSSNTFIQVYDVEGKLITEKKNLLGKTVDVDLSNNVKGVYFIQVFNGDMKLLNKKIIIQ